MSKPGKLRFTVRRKGPGKTLAETRWKPPAQTKGTKKTGGTS